MLRCVHKDQYRGGKYEFTFERDVIFDPGVKETAVARGRNRYVFDGDTLKWIIEDQ